jgi:type II secretory pathway pseudopilin PulG
MTLVEVAVAMGVLAMLGIGVVSELTLSSRLAMVASFQSAATSIVQGYLEQINTVDPGQIPLSKDVSSSTLQTLKLQRTTDETMADNLSLAPLPVLHPDDQSDIISGTVPAKLLNTTWDNQRSYPVNRYDGSNDLTIHLWIWTEDKTAGTITPTNPAKQIVEITIVYMTEYTYRGQKHYFLGSVRTLRSCTNTY